MFDRKHRLNRNKDFDQVFLDGQSAYSTSLGIKITPNHLEMNRFGILVSTKISKKAVIRNRIKRRIRAALKELNKGLKVGFDIVILTLPTIIEADFATIVDELKGNLKKLKLND